MSHATQTSSIRTIAGNGVHDDLSVPVDALTLGGFRRWVTSHEFPENRRACFLKNELYIAMSPEEIETHVVVKGEITYTVTGINKRTKKGRVYPDGVLFTNEEAGLSVEPDCTYVSFDSLHSGRVRLTPREGAEGEFIELVGSPDWLLEVASRGSVRKDIQLLPELYFLAGVLEYWLVNARGKKISFQILERGELEFIAAEKKGTWQRSNVFGRWFRLTRKKDAVGMWEYSLESKADQK